MNTHTFAAVLLELGTIHTHEQTRTHINTKYTHTFAGKLLELGTSDLSDT
jgi:hypothetical protein